jgi:hypothetical protein
MSGNYMPARELRIMGMLRRTAEKMSQVIASAEKIHEEIPRIQALSETTKKIAYNVEKHKQHHFDKLIDLGIATEKETGIEILKHTGEIANAYGIHRSRGNQELAKEIIEHVKHIGRYSDPKMIIAFGRVAQHLQKMNSISDSNVLVKLLKYARKTHNNSNPEFIRQQYVERMSEIESAMRKYMETKNSEHLLKILAKFEERQEYD